MSPRLLVRVIAHVQDELVQGRFRQVKRRYAITAAVYLGQAYERVHGEQPGVRQLMGYALDYARRDGHFGALSSAVLRRLARLSRTPAPKEEPCRP